jgi:BirA family biotin operon repressor/biotin-[acetyl-CoA-carboxylase] ligase
LNQESLSSDLEAALNRILDESFVRRIEFRRSLPSTNDLAMELAVNPAVEAPLLVLTDEQTAGRGRGANRWWSGPGALTFSLILEPAVSSLQPAQWPRVALTTGLSICEVLQELVPNVACGLKWPNDVFLGAKKVCGILVEVPSCRPPLPQRIVLGVGLNVNNSLARAPDDVSVRATALCDVAPANWNRADVLLSVLRRLDRNLQALGTNDPALIEKWQQRCVLRNRNVEIEFGARRIRGLCRGIAADGTLILETERGREQVAGGVLISMDLPGRGT